MESIKRMTDAKLKAEYTWLDNYLSEVVSRKDVLKLEMLAREMERRGLEIEGGE